MWIDYFLKGKYLPDIDGKNRIVLFTQYDVCYQTGKNTKRTHYFQQPKASSGLAYLNNTCHFVIRDGQIPARILPGELFFL
jgi:hypothetical protein